MARKKSIKKKQYQEVSKISVSKKERLDFLKVDWAWVSLAVVMLIMEAAPSSAGRNLCVFWAISA